MQICFLIIRYEQIVKLEHLLCPKGGGHKPTCAPPPPHFWKWGHVATLPPFSYAPEYKSKTFILDMPLSRSVRIYSKRDVIYTIDRMAFHKTNTHDLQCTIKLIWLDVYWNLMSDKICISFYQFRCYQLLFKELCMNTPNRNQFDTWIVHHACEFY